MVVVQGKHCPVVKQKCIKHMRDYEQETKAREEKRARGQLVPPRRVPERCQEYSKPSTCLSKVRDSMRFCIDRHEWPNVVGKLPDHLATWTFARKSCEGIGKRLCTSAEFNFACEGEEMRPYATGFVRKADDCVMDKPYVFPKRKMMPYADCMERPWCRAQQEELDQREPIGAHPKCATPEGVMDLNGNVNEWVERPGKEAPWRSGLKGGWWGPARSRCRPMVTAHDENYAGYEVGFRCCKTADPVPGAEQGGAR